MICSPVDYDRVMVLLSRAAQLTGLLDITTSGCVVWLCGASGVFPLLGHRGVGYVVMVSGPKALHSMNECHRDVPPCVCFAVTPARIRGIEYC